MERKQTQTLLALGMDSDTHPSFFKQGDYPRAIDVDVSNTSKRGGGNIIQTTLGNKQIVNAELPEGDNICIGKAEDAATLSVVYFIANSEGNHCIFRFYSQSETLVKLVESPLLNFIPTFLIHSTVIVNDLCYWTDRYNPPRKINLKKAEEGGYADYNFDVLDLIKAPPIFPPLASYGQDATRILNYLAGKWFQFRARYWFDDGEITALSPVSKLLFDGQYSPSISPFNYIELDYSDSSLEVPRLNSSDASRSVITHIEICMRRTDPQTGDWETNGTDQVWRSVEVLSLTDMINTPTPYKLKFYNDSAYPIIPTAEALKVYDSVPYLAGTLDFIQDRLFFGDVEEGWFVIKDRRRGLDQAASVNVNYGNYGEKPPYAEALANGYEFNATDINPSPFIPQIGVNNHNPVIPNEFLLTFDTISDGSSVDIDTNGTVLIVTGATIFINLIFIYTISNLTPKTGVAGVDGLERWIISKNGVAIKIIEITSNGSFAETVILEGSAGDEFEFKFQTQVNGVNIDSASINSNNASLVATAGGYKRYGAYEFMLVYFDQAGRIGATGYPIPVYVKGEAEDLDDTVGTLYKTGTAWLTWQILHLPPKEATHYQWTRTKDLNHNRYLEHIVQDVRYVKRFTEDPDGNLDLAAIQVPYSSADKKEIYISLRSVEFFRDVNTDSSIDAWIPEQGDRMRLIASSETNYYQKVYDVPIKGMRGEYLVISLADATEILPEIKKGYLVEVYTPKLQADVKIFYEFSEIYEIGNAGGENRFHKANTTNQIASEGNLVDLFGTPAVGIFRGGDTYYRKRNHIRREVGPGYPITLGTEIVLPYYIESNQISDFVRSGVNDIGRAFVYDANAKRQFYKTKVRFTNPFNEQITQNGLSSVEALSEKILPTNYGRLRRLIAIAKDQQEGDVMLAICEKATVSLYIFEAFIQTADSRLISISEKVIPKENKLKGEYGTMHPESVVVYDENCYWFDINARAVIRYGYNGLKEISEYQQETFFFNLTKEIMPNREWFRVYGGIDPEKHLYIISFSPETTLPISLYPAIPDWLPNATNPYPTIEVDPITGVPQPIILPLPIPPEKIDLTVYSACCATIKPPPIDPPIDPDPDPPIDPDPDPPIEPPKPIPRSTAEFSNSGNDTDGDPNTPGDTYSSQLYIPPSKPVLPFIIDVGDVLVVQYNYDLVWYTHIMTVNFVFYQRNIRGSLTFPGFHRQQGVGVLNWARVKSVTKNSPWVEIGRDTPPAQIGYPFYSGRIAIPENPEEEGEEGEIIIPSTYKYPTLTTAFHTKADRWVTDYSFSVEQMARIGHQTFLTFKKGKLYIHNVEGSNTFHEILFDPAVSHYFTNENPKEEKLWMGIRIDANEKWFACEITNEKGQETHLISEDFFEIEGKFYADILCDELTDDPNILHPLLNGDLIRSVWIKVCFRPESNEKQSEFYFATAISKVSSGHK